MKKELQSKDLRIGNILNYDTAEGDVLPTVIDWQDLKWLTEDPKGFNLVHSPIPLTKEWLLKCGFEELKDKYYLFYLDRLTLRYLYTHSGGNWYFEIEDERVNIHFVHEFQNLFFAITGRELELKNDSIN